MDADDTRTSILIVDDQPKNLLAMEALLENSDYRLVTAESGEKALKALLREDFAVILLDVMMPGMDGFETAELIRSRDRSRYTPIIFVTALSTDETDVARGYTVGAVDYLFKPIVPQIMRSKVAAFVELFRKAEELKRQEQQLRALQQREHESKLAEAERRLEAELLRREMNLAREIQQHLFPKNPVRRLGLDIAGRSVPANAAGGDYFDFIDKPGEHVDVVIGDVSGHGVGPALLMAATRAYLRAYAPNCATPGEVLEKVNRVLCQDIVGEQFVTLLMVRIAADGSSYVFANAGHNPGFVLAPRGELKQQLEATGLPLGIAEDVEYATSPVMRLDADEIMLLYTDGVVEASGPDQPAFGVERTIACVRDCTECSAADMITSVHAAIAAHCLHAPQQDDITLLVVRAQGSG